MSEIPSRKKVDQFVAAATVAVKGMQRLAEIEGAFALVFVGVAQDARGPHNVVQVDGTCPQSGLDAAGRAVLEVIERHVVDVAKGGIT